MIYLLPLIWVRFLVANLLFENELIGFNNIGRLIPDIYRNPDRKLKKMKKSRVLKCHEYFDPKYRKIIYIIRDPRDVAVSYYFFHLGEKKIPNNFPIERYMSKFISGKLDPYGTWTENIGSWLDARKINPKFLVLFYEKMISQIETEVKRIANFLGKKPDSSTLKKVIELSSATYLRKLSKTIEYYIRKPRNFSFVRSVKSGEGQSVLPKSSVQQIKDK
ncbi:MAG: sulfotransferase domain-containing protein [Promethearchaeota archaeon]